MRKIFSLLIASSIVSGTLSTFAFAQKLERSASDITELSSSRGTDVGNGGDWVVLEFKNRMREVENFLNEKGNNIHGLNLELLSSIIKETQVRVSSKPLKDKNGKEVDALNFFPAKNEIILYRKRWFEYFLEEKKVLGLVYHELLPAFGKDDTDFRLSGEFARKMQGASYAESTSQLAGRLYMALRILENHAAGEDLEFFPAICFRLGVAESQAQTFVSAASAEIVAMPLADQDLANELKHFSNTLSGLISFCVEGYVAVPTAVDGSEESFGIGFGDRVELRKRVAAKRVWLYENYLK